ncbi:dihydrolipoyl dehydrogenase [Georgenia wangjunii]|uniref:dihydrolipoyl dehydrogenase n=1 Tax=Georgenia wangjunii TaxID=3117730 RepID=UPI002F263E19
MVHHDAVVLGAGPGGYAAAIRLAQLGLDTAIVERRYWGGVCLSVGCIPSKVLLRGAELVNVVASKGADFGLVGDVGRDFGPVFDHSRRAAEGRVEGVHHLLRKNGVRQYYGHGELQDEHTLTVGRADPEVLTFGSAVIATGSEVRTLPGVPLSDNVVDYETQILDRRVPASIAIIGAGAIGMEFAYVLATYGAQVTVIEYADRVLPAEDAESSAEVARAYGELGITLRTSTSVRTAADDGTGVTLTYTGPDGEGELRVERVLVSVGFTPRTHGFGLERTGVALTERGAIAVDDAMRTSVPHLLAIGDVTGKLALAHVADAQAMVAAETVAGLPTVGLGDYRMMPRVTFCQPQVASFGLTEAQARAEGHDVRVARFPFSANAKARGMAEPRGFVKVLAGADGQLLGAHLVGVEVAEMLPELTLARRTGLTAGDLARNVHVHPTLGEALQEAFRGLTGAMVNL